MCNMKCPKCQSEVRDNAKFCSKCGCNLSMVQPVKMEVPDMQICVGCGTKLAQGAKFCTVCGTPVVGAQTQQASITEEPVVEEPKTEVEQPAVPEEPKAEEPRIELEQPIVPQEPKVEEPKVAVEQPIVPEEPKVEVYKQKQPVIPEEPKNEVPKQEQSVIPQELKTEEKVVTVVPQQQIYGNMVQPNQPQPIPQPVNNIPETKKPTKNKNVKIAIIAALGVVVAVVAIVAVVLLVWKGKITLPISGQKTETVVETGSEATSEEETQASETSESSQTQVDVEELIASADDTLSSGKEMIEKDEELLNGIDTIKSAIDQYKEKSAEVGDSEVIADRIKDAYTSYTQAVIKRKDILSGQNLSGGIYGQVMNEMNAAISYGEELNNEGYKVDFASLTAVRDAFDTLYRAQIIKAFDEFTQREAWSRTEAWNLMSDTPDNMFENSDLDNPIRLRYAYALAWWTQKQIETDMASGIITGKGAALKIADVIEATDYNLMLIDMYIQFMNEAGEDCSAVATAYNEVIAHIAETQGLNIGTDVDLAHFWYFNDFGENSVDATNGVTQENREWIRNRMSTVELK